MDHLHYEVDVFGRNVIEVKLASQANVLLLDTPNYNNYRNGRDYRYLGGLAKKSPVRLVPPHSGHWHVVVNLGGYSGTIEASVRVIS